MYNKGREQEPSYKDTRNHTEVTMVQDLCKQAYSYT